MKDLWITINCYFICAFYYSTQELLERENNIKEFDNNWPLSIIMS